MSCRLAQRQEYELYRVGKRAVSLSDLPPVSVVMAVRNEARSIRRSLEAVLAQNYPSDLIEVIVVDGMSEDGTRDVLAKLESEGRGQGAVALRVIDNPKRIVSCGLNIGITHAKGEIIVRVDGHAIVPYDYVKQCVERLQSTGADCVGGAVDSVGTGYVGEAIAATMRSPFGVGSSAFRTARECDNIPVAVETVPFGAFPRTVFERIGLFSEEMIRHQDYEFNYRLRKAGGTILLLPWLRVKYYVRSSLGALRRQYWQYGVWKGRFMRAHPDSIRIRHLIPPLFVLGMVLSSILVCVSELGLWCLSLLFGSYFLFLLVASLALAWRNGFRLFPVLPLVISCLHLSWGAGVWFGLASATRRRGDGAERSRGKAG